MSAITKIASRLFLKNSSTRNQDVEDFIGRLHEITSRDDVIRPGKLAVKQKKITGTPMENLPLIQKLGMIPFLVNNFRQVTKSYDHLNISPIRNSIEKDELKALEDFTKKHGVVAIGYTSVDPDDILIGKGILYDNAMVISIRMPADKMRLAPSYATLKMIQHTYAQTGIVVNRIAALLRKQGFGAQPGPGLGGFTTYPVLALKAKMGVFVRSGLLMTPESGPCHRLAVVYTNIKNLPSNQTLNYNWVKDYCDKCGLCIRECPAQAIRSEPVKVNTKHLEYIEYEKCMAYFAGNYGCSVCVKVCPFFTQGYDKLHRMNMKAKPKMEV